jgi:hypothetical protein
VAGPLDTLDCRYAEGVTLAGLVERRQHQCIAGVQSGKRADLSTVRSKRQMDELLIDLKFRMR